MNDLVERARAHAVQNHARINQRLKYSFQPYDVHLKAVADLVSFLVWMGEPVAEKRKSIGTVVLIFLAGMFVLAYALKKNYWKDIH